MNQIHCQENSASLDPWVISTGIGKWHFFTLGCVDVYMNVYLTIQMHAYILKFVIWFFLIFFTMPMILIGNNSLLNFLDKEWFSRFNDYLKSTLAWLSIEFLECSRAYYLQKFILIQLSVIANYVVIMKQSRCSE